MSCRARCTWQDGARTHSLEVRVIANSMQALANRLQHGYRTGGSAPESRPALCSEFRKAEKPRKGVSLSETDSFKERLHRSRRCRRPLDGSNNSISPQGDLLALLCRRWNVETRRRAATTGRPVESDSEERQRLQALLRLSQSCSRGLRSTWSSAVRLRV